MRRVWLASYPKSGNTWFRMLIAALSATAERPFDINDLTEPGRSISARRAIDDATMIETALLRHDEADVLRSQFYTEAFDVLDATSPSMEPRFYKTHDAYVSTADGDPGLGRGTARAAIVLIRDPRDVVVSMAHHFGASLDWTIDFMNDEQAALGGPDDDRGPHFRQRLLTWAGHVASWLDQKDVPALGVHYESLLEDPVDTFMQALTFAGRLVTREESARAVELAAFQNCQGQERLHGFREGPRHGAAFFRSGRSGCWREVLTAQQLERLEAAQGAMMHRLGYECGRRGSGAAVWR